MFFWARRCQRLLPNALLVIVCTGLIAWFFLGPYAIRQTASDLIWATGFAANWQFIREFHDYFAASSPTPRLTTHYWSLAVEEQFYITWPLLIAGLGLYSTQLSHVQLKRRLYFLFALALISFAALLYQTDRDPRQAYYDTTVRAWEFLCGGMLALKQTRFSSLQKTYGQGMRLLLESAALLAVAAAAYGFDSQSKLRAWSILVPVFATMVLIEIGRDGKPALAILRHRIFVAMGRRSYSVYLWHWPVLILTKYAFGSESGPVLALAFALNLILAQLSWRFVEVPARYHWARDWSSAKVLLCAGLSIVSIVSVAFALRASDSAGWQAMQANITQSLALPPALVAQRDRPAIYSNGCHLSGGQTQPKLCQFGATPSRSTVVLFGNSLAAQWFSPLESIAAREGMALVNMTKSSCPALDVQHVYSASKRSYSECAKWVEHSLQLIESIQPQWVIINGIEPLSAHVLQRHAKRHDLESFESSKNLQNSQWALALERVLRRIQNAGATPILIRHTPTHRADVLDCLYTRGPAACTVALPSARSSLTYWDLEVASRLKIEVWDFNADICPQGRCEAYRADLGGVVTYSDADHLTDHFVRKLEPQISTKWKASMQRLK